MNKWKKKYKKLKKKYLLLNQGSLLHCEKCGWNTIIPYEDTICLNCHYWEDKMKEKEKNPLDTSEENLKIEVRRTTNETI
jgi:uncharacterized Zn finger protein (UPF0148 family)